jgi:CheY-like chemotaxis protein
MSNSKSEKTILVVNSNVNVLVLMRGLLENDYRVLLAADAESALRLLAIDGLHLDLAVVDHKVRGLRTGGLRQRIKEVLPDFRILPMAGSVQDGVIKLRALGRSNHRTSGSLLQRIRVALAVDESLECASRSDISSGVPEVTCMTTTFMVV